MSDPPRITLPTPTLPEGYAHRVMREEDIDAVLLNEYAAYPHPWPEIIWRSQLATAWSYIVLVHPTSEPDRILAQVIFWIVHDELHLLNIATNPSARRTGLGKALMRLLFDVCKQERLQYITLEVRISNTPAIGLYESFGFSEVGRRKRYYSDNGEDALVLALELEDGADDGAADMDE